MMMNSLSKIQPRELPYTHLSQTILMIELNIILITSNITLLMMSTKWRKLFGMKMTFYLAIRCSLSNQVMNKNVPQERNPEEFHKEKEKQKKVLAWCGKKAPSSFGQLYELI